MLKHFILSVFAISVFSLQAYASKTSRCTDFSGNERTLCASAYAIASVVSPISYVAYEPLETLGRESKIAEEEYKVACEYEGHQNDAEITSCIKRKKASADRLTVGPVICDCTGPKHPGVRHDQGTRDEDILRELIAY